ncbi:MULTISPECIES: YbhB/YbcL family Raf kinase inhibitor-like protein [unclassified Synechococcus]|uniref:YbhB/YbcL family Raf kinase inhibitor-like protein n=1 Tax=unclassified Synechococcus TaxID=2626047 RepID=UPI0000698E87|nr:MULTISPECIES: YbhB/YbcL family Raf kinase inhibitor-like protein [unclassified Synechococcus]EAQ73927.1 hypothetical protein WH5701_09830 [Synechococcus sp. WH 5701]WFN57941.1 YbhB/YbcL family Raf kinase inhibitor-like protein [Synechococcus sp. CCFWC 502]
MTSPSRRSFRIKGAATALLAVVVTNLGAMARSESFSLISPEIKANGTIAAKHVFNGFGCTGENISPALSWSQAPPQTQSFALLVHDSDAPTGGSGWWHWLVVDIPASSSKLLAGAGRADGMGLPQGARQIRTDYGSPGWGGPCPPVGNAPHRYTFTLHALKVKRLELPPDPSAALVGFMVNSQSLGMASFTALYGR